MTETILNNHGAYFLYGLIAGFFLIAFWESLWPRRKAVVSTPRRWLVNLGLFVINVTALRWVVPFGYLSAALVTEQEHWGLFNLLAVPMAVSLPLTLLAFDLLRYLTHRLLHSVPVLWLFHAVHHSDPDYDLTIGYRFHPVEAIVTGYVNLGFIFLLGPSALAIFVVELIQVFINVFAHGNVRMPQRLERWLRLIVVTPDMHRIHHSALRYETDSNFGNIFSFWDRWLGSYVAAPHRPLAQLPIGLDSVSTRDALSIRDLLLRPFKSRLRMMEPER